MVALGDSLKVDLSVFGNIPYILPQKPHFSQPTQTRYSESRVSLILNLFLTPPMNIQHFEKGFHYNDRELIIVARKLGKLATYCRQVKDEASFIRVDAERQASKKDRDQLLVSVTVNLPGKRLFSDSRRNDVIEALDRCIEKLEPQVKRYKEMGTTRSKARRER